MIPSPSAEFTAEESRQIGTDPFFQFTIYPFFFDVGVGAGEGTADNITFVPPDRLSVDAGVDSATWTSDPLTTQVGGLPTPVTATWTASYPGFTILVEFRTAATTAALAAAAWSTIESGDSLSVNLYYQWRVSFESYRAFAFDTLELAEADASSAWAMGDPNDESDESFFEESWCDSAANDYISYAVDAAFGAAAYVEDFTLEGEFTIPDEDISDGGSLSLAAPNDFSSLISSDHSLFLINRNNKYSTRHPSFIFAGEADWQRKHLRIKFGFTVSSPGGGSKYGSVKYGSFKYGSAAVAAHKTDTILLYTGDILKWGPSPISMDREGYEAGEVEIYSRDSNSLFMDRYIGMPDSAGKPAPVVTGQIMREATHLGDNSLAAADAEVDYESDILSELSTVDASGAGNTIEISATDPYEGSGCLKAHAAVTGYGRGWINFSATTDNFLFKTKIKFDQIPGSPPTDYRMSFLRITAGVSDLVILEVDSEYRVILNYNGTRTETDWYVNRNQGIWSELAIGVYGLNPGLIRISLDGNQVLNYDQDGSGNPLDLSPLAAMSRIGIGVTLAGDESYWDVYFDKSETYLTYNPEAYYVPGAPYEAIGTVYVDGVVRVGQPLLTNKVVKSFAGGKAAPALDITKDPANGQVIFSDLANPPSGSVYFMLNKDSTSHPADAIEAILVAGGCDDLINAASFAAAKALCPNDTVGCFFEELSMADAILAIAKLCLINVIVAQGEVKLLAYDGTAPSASEAEWDIDESVCGGLTPSDDSETKKNKISAKWGLYEMNSRLFHVAQDAESVAKIGTFDEELDFSWGNEVGSDNGDMVKIKAAHLLNRLKGSLALHEDVAALPWKFVRAEIGDSVEVDIADVGPAETMRIVGKDLTLSRPYGINLTLALYPGES